MTSEEKKILLVEDEKTIRDAVAAYLECSTDLEKLTVKEAVEKGRKLCGYED